MSNRRSLPPHLNVHNVVNRLLCCRAKTLHRKRADSTRNAGEQASVIAARFGSVDRYVAYNITTQREHPFHTLPEGDTRWERAFKDEGLACLKRVKEESRIKRTTATHANAARSRTARRGERCQVRKEHLVQRRKRGERVVPARDREQPTQMRCRHARPSIRRIARTNRAAPPTIHCADDSCAVISTWGGQVNVGTEARVCCQGTVDRQRTHGGGSETVRR